MFDRSPTPDPLAIDQIIGRQPGLPILAEYAYLLWLEEGLSVHTISTTKVIDPEQAMPWQHIEAYPNHTHSYEEPTLMHMYDALSEAKVITFATRGRRAKHLEFIYGYDRVAGFMSYTPAMDGVTVDAYPPQVFPQVLATFWDKQPGIAIIGE
jgi:hypothetical protein